MTEYYLSLFLQSPHSAIVMSALGMLRIYMPSESSDDRFAG